MSFPLHYSLFREIIPWSVNVVLMVMVYECRVRIGATPLERTICSDRMGALEKSIRDYAENPNETVIKPELGTSFDSLGEAYDFYNLYSWENGFGIRYGKSRLNVTRTKCMQEIVCGCAVSLFMIIFTSLSRDALR